MTCYLYRHFDIGHRLLYVGISLRVMSRLEQHRLAALWFDQIASVEITRYPDKKAAMSAEKAAIKIDRPLFNKIHAEPPVHTVEEEWQRVFMLMSDIEPDLWEMFEEAVNTPEHICANVIWYREMKPRLLKFVGDYATDPLLKSHLAYDAAYRTLYDMLPNCGPHCCQSEVA